MALLQRLQNLFSGPADDPSMAQLYGACVTQARRPAFYETLGVPDTVDGRFDMLLLHVFLVVRRLKDEPQAQQQLFDMMFADMDRNLREMGVGDMSIGKKIKPMITAFYGRAQAYEKALAAGNDALATSLQRNLYAENPAAAENARRMADYTRRTVAALDTQPTAEILAGRPAFGPPVL